MVFDIFDIEVKTVSAAGLGALVALLAGATTAHADPGVPPPPPPPALVAPVVPGPAPAAPVPVSAPPGPVPAVPGEAVPVTADAATPAEVPHLVSPENLPPGTSITPVGPQQSNGGSYLRELWHAVQTQEVSGKDALLLLTQRPLNANATPPPGLAANPQPMPAATPPPAGDPLQQAAAPVPPAAPAPAPVPAPPTP